MAGMPDQPSSPPSPESPRRRLGEILIERGLLDEKGLAAALAEQAGCEMVDPRVVRLDPDLLARVDPYAARRLGFLPLTVDTLGTVAVLVADPTDDRMVVEVRQLLEAEIELVVAAPEPLRERIARAWDELAEPTRADEDEVILPEDEEEEEEEDAGEPPDGGDAAPEVAEEPMGAPDGDGAEPEVVEEEPEDDVMPEPTGTGPATLDLATGAGPSLPELVRSLGRNQGPEAWRELLPALVGNAIQWSADAVRFEGNSKQVVVAFRLDGSWRVLLRLPAAVQGGLLASLLALAGQPEDGELEALHGCRLEARVGPDRMIVLAMETLSMGPASRITVTVRDPDRRLALADLGLSKELARRLRQWTAARQGLLLLVGVPDSGRTSLLRALAAPMAGYRQVAALLHDPVRAPEAGWFERGRSDDEGLAGLAEALATNPRVLLVDDCDTPRLARAAFATALQDRLVIASLRGRDGAQALQRLRDQGLDDLFLGEQLVGVIETRLVRLLCSACWSRGPLDRDLAVRLGLVLDTMPSQVAVAGPGCPHCHHTGYRGRTGLFGRVELAGGVPDGCSPEDLMAAVESNRPRRPAEAGLSLVIQNRTSLQELGRVLAAVTMRPTPPVEPEPEPALERSGAVAAEVPSPDHRSPAVQEPTDASEPTPEEPKSAEAAPETELSDEEAGQPLVSVASPIWDPKAPEETVAGQPRPPGLFDDEEPPDPVDALLDLEEAEGDDRHVLLALGPRGEIADRLAASLPEAEFRVVPARNLSDAMDFARSELPTAIALPSGWHFDTCGALRAFRDDLASAFLPLVVLSEDKGRVVEFLRAGADEVILTGVGGEELELRVRAVIRRVT